MSTTEPTINTNVRLFDLVRHQRSALHKDGLITDEEYAWLCGSEMAMSPQGGSPSPRRLEDYDHMRETLRNAEAELSVAVAERDDYRRKMIATEAYQCGLAADVEAMREAVREAERVLIDLVEHISECDESDLLRCDSDPHPPSVFSVYANFARATLAKLQPLLKP